MARADGRGVHRLPEVPHAADHRRARPDGPQAVPQPRKPDFAFPTLVENLLPPGLVGLVMAGLIAAVMSHISGAVNSCTTIATVDFYLPYISKNATEAQAVRFGKIVGGRDRDLGDLLGHGPGEALRKADLRLSAECLRLRHARHRHHVPAGHPLEADDPRRRAGGGGS